MTNRQKSALIVAILTQTILILALGGAMVVTMKPENVSGTFFVIFMLLNVSCIHTISVMESVTSE